MPQPKEGAEWQFKNDLGADVELARLRRQYVLLVRDRQQTLSCKLQKQKRVTAIFRKEHANLLNDLVVAKSTSKAQEDKKSSEKLNLLLIEYDYYSEEVKTKHTHIREIDGQIKMMKKKKVDAISRLETDRQREDRFKFMRNVLDTLENKLELQMRRIGSISWVNRKMREEIDHMMFERAHFLKVWNILIRKLTLGKKFMMDLIEQATIAYDQREEWWQKLQTLRVKVHQDALIQLDLMRGYTRRYDDSQKMEQFFGTKGQKRLILDLNEKRRLKREERAKKCRETLLEYETMLVSVLTFAREGDVDTICNNFVKAEQHNFMSFVFINDMIAELEVIGDRLGVLHGVIDEKRVRHQMRIEQQSYRIEEIQEDLKLAQWAREKSQDELNKCNSDLETMLSGTNEMIRIVRCDTDPILQLLGKNNHMQNFNVQFFLELLERRIHDLILKVYPDKHVNKKVISFESIAQKRSKEDAPHTYGMHLINQIVEETTCPLCVEHEMVAGADVMDSRVRRPWTQDEVKFKLRVRLELPDGSDRIHSVSHCLLPKSREIIQKRYQ